MPSPGSSPRNTNPVASPSAMRQSLQSPRQSSTPGSTIREGGQAGATQISTSQWQISRISTLGQTNGSHTISHQGISSTGSTGSPLLQCPFLMPTHSCVDEGEMDSIPTTMYPSIEAQPALGHDHPDAQTTRRAMMNLMRSNVSERRRSRAQSQAVTVGINSAAQGMGGVSEESLSSFVAQLGAQGFDAIANNIANQGQPQQQQLPQQTRVVAGTMHRFPPSATNNERQPYSPLRHKVVYLLHCTYCSRRVCNRAMKAILLADTKIELYSTDIPPAELALINEDRMTHGCHCRIRDTVCTGCGNVLGYHVSQPCERCLDAKNNGHFWMFYSETVQPRERADPATGKALFWGSLSPMREYEEQPPGMHWYETYCR